MKREFLEGLGLGKEEIDKILDENSRDIGRQKKIAEAAMKPRSEPKRREEAPDGTDAEAARARIETLTSELDAAREVHRSEAETLNRRMEAAEFLSGYRFVNGETRAYYAAKLEEAMADEANAGKSKNALLDAMTTGGDGNPKANIFAEERPHSVVLPPSGGAGDAPEDNPFSKESWNMAEQARLYREDKERAKALAREGVERQRAGGRAGGQRPDDGDRHTGGAVVERAGAENPDIRAGGHF